MYPLGFTLSLTIFVALKFFQSWKLSFTFTVYYHSRLSKTRTSWGFFRLILSHVKSSYAGMLHIWMPVGHLHHGALSLHWLRVIGLSPKTRSCEDLFCCSNETESDLVLPQFVKKKLSLSIALETKRHSFPKTTFVRSFPEPSNTVKNLWDGNVKTVTNYLL
jgi:hypothetical protein